MTTKVSVVDDDLAVLDSLRLLLATHRMEAACYTDAPALLADPAASSCIISDVRMPVMTGLDLMTALASRGDTRPIILLTGHGDIQMAVQAIKQGAYDFIEKPFEPERLLGAVDGAIAKTEKQMTELLAIRELQERHATLSERQKETMALLVRGLANKEIAARLGISPRTVEIHRTWVMNKMAAKTLAELVKIGLALKLS